MAPNFLIAGGVAAGTSFLSAILAHHPDIYLPRVQRPEPNFFHYSWKFNKGMEWYLRTWFHEIGSQRAIGERSSLLLTSNYAAGRIKQTLPEVKLIFCLRNPLERAWGNYRFTVLEGLEPLSFDDAIQCESSRIKNADGKWAEVQPHAYLYRSHYSQRILEFIKLFGKNRILLVKSEDLGRNPQENVKRVCQFLEVDSSISLPTPPNYSSPAVINRRVQMELRTYFKDRFPELVECIRKEEDVSSLISHHDDIVNIDRLRANLRSSKDSLPLNTRLHLRKLFASEIERIKSLVDFSIDDWV
jgi:hypothetical protein